MWYWQRGYIELFLEAVSNADWLDPEQAKGMVVAQMKAYEPSDELQFLMELSIEPVAAKEGLLQRALRTDVGRSHQNYLGGMRMVVEYIRYSIDGERAEAFEAAYRERPRRWTPRTLRALRALPLKRGAHPARRSHRVGLGGGTPRGLP